MTFPNLFYLEARFLFGQAAVYYEYELNTRSSQ